MRFRTLLASGLLWTLYVTPAAAEQTYEHPPQEILDVMNAPAPPVAIPAPCITRPSPIWPNRFFAWPGSV